MKAIVCTRYGPPEALQLQEVAKPVPKDDEVLVRIVATTVGPTNVALLRADPVIIRFVDGFFRPRNPIPGTLFAGDIEAVGNEAKHFKVGDAVFGNTVRDGGCSAEYACVSEEGMVAIKPASMTYAEAAGVCDGAATSLTFLRDKAGLRRGQKVLVNGASGSVGIAAVQLAKHFGAEVTGVCSAKNMDLVRSVGADTVIDYTTDDFSKRREAWDVVFDAIGKSSFSRCKRALKQGGVYLTTVPTLAVMLHMLWTSKMGKKKAVFAATGFSQTKEKMHFLIELIEAGKLRTVIDRHYSLEQIAEAYRYVEKGHKAGDVVITMEQNGN